jgi:photosystem II stability/assembly factor-like uncharacterized protein
MLIIAYWRHEGFMYDRLYRYLLMIVFCSVIGLCIGCSANAGHGETRSDGRSSEPSSLVPTSPPDNVTVRFVLEPATTPEPGVKGNIVDKQYAWVTDMDLGDLLRTIDGGQTWQRMRLLTEDESRFGRPRDMHIRTFFITPTRGWLMANSGTWQTEDGGLTWRRLFAGLFDDLQFADEQHGWMNLADSESGQQSYVTEDGGQKWVPCGPKRDYGKHVPGQNSYFLTPQIGWAVTNKAEKKDRRTNMKGIAKSTDGGCTWNQLWINRDSDVRYSDIYFVNEDEGWLAGEGSLLHTRDGGKSWSEISRPTNDTNVLHLYFVNSKEGWIIGGYPLMPADDTGVFSTCDGGASWRQLSERDIVEGFDENGRHFQVPENWKAGKLIQLLYSSKVKIQIR